MEVTTVRRFIAKESETLELTPNRGKGEKLLLSKDDADRLLASYEPRRGPVSDVEVDSIDMETSTLFNLFRRHFQIESR